MKYLMLVCTDPSAPPYKDPSAPPYKKDEDTMDEWIEDVLRRGVHIVGERLRPASESTTVIVRNGKTQVIDGPFVETSEIIAGFDLLDCADLDEAIEIASGHPMARFGRLELRPVWPFE